MEDLLIYFFIPLLLFFAETSMFTVTTSNFGPRHI